MRSGVLIVEDEPVVALDIEAALQNAGHAIAGLASTAERATELIEQRGCDLAVLDANLRGASVEPLALKLKERGVPFLVVSGYGRSHLPPALQMAPFLAKPFTPADLVRAVNELVNPVQRETEQRPGQG